MPAGSAKYCGSWEWWRDGRYRRDPEVGLLFDELPVFFKAVALSVRCRECCRSIALEDFRLPRFVFLPLCKRETLAVGSDCKGSIRYFGRGLGCGGERFRRIGGLRSRIGFGFGRFHTVAGWFVILGLWNCFTGDGLVVRTRKVNFGSFHDDVACG